MATGIGLEWGEEALSAMAVFFLFLVIVIVAVVVGTRRPTPRSDASASRADVRHIRPSRRRLARYRVEKDGLRRS